MPHYNNIKENLDTAQQSCITKTTLQTTNNTPQTIHSVSLAANTTYAIEAVVIYRNATIRGMQRLRVGAYRNSGNASLVGFPETLWEELGATNVSLDVSGNDLRLRVTGLPATTINWTAYLYLWSGA